MKGPSNAVINYHTVRISLPTNFSIEEAGHLITSAGNIALITNFINGPSSVSVVTVASSPTEVLTFETDEELTIVTKDGLQTDIVTVLDYQYAYVPGTTIMGASRSEVRATSVNTNGSLQVGFLGGDPYVDSWGTLISSDAQIIGLHSVTNPQSVTTVLTSGAELTSDPDALVGILSAGNGADSISVTTDLYHPHVPGFGLKVIVPAKITNINPSTTYRWGYYDDANGYFFEQAGQTLTFVIRSSVSGTVQERRIPQAEWNRDKVNGTGSPYNPSLETLDPTDYHLYFINLKNRAVAGVGFGFLRSSGEEITCHIIEDSADKKLPPIQTSELPARWEVINDSPIPNGPAELHTAGTLVQLAGNTRNINTSNIETNHSWFRPTLAVSNSDTTWTHLGSFRAGSTSPVTGGVNRFRTVPAFISYFIETAPSQVIITVDAPMTGNSWQEAHPLSALEYDITGTITGQAYGNLVFSRYYQAGTHIVNVDEIFDRFGKTLTTKADGSPGHVFSFFIRKVGGSANPSSVGLAVDWIDF